MERIALPVFPADMKLATALDELRNLRLSGLVTHIGNRPTVLEADALLKGTAVAGTALGDVTPTQVTISFDDWQPDLGVTTDQDRAASLLDESGALFGVTGAAALGDTTGMVITRHEGLAMGLNVQIAYCTCRGPLQHFCAPGDALDPGRCNDCGFGLDCG